jgi:nitrogen PTS system EIIA component
MHFGATLRLLRVQAGFSLRGLAERVGVSNAYLSRVEHGHDAPPTLDRLAAIAQVFGLPATTLIELDDRVGPLASDYLERVPAARQLVLDLYQRELGPIEIARVRAFIAREFPSRSAGQRGGLASMVDVSRMVIGMTCHEIEDVIDVAVTKLAAVTRRSIRELGVAIRERERACPSAVGGGLCLPHAILEGVKPAAVVVTLSRGITGECPDGLPLRAFFVHVHPGGRAHARALAEMSKLADARIVSRLSCIEAPADLLTEVLAQATG